jgi:PAS domain S-box-containing protein
MKVTPQKYDQILAETDIIWVKDIATNKVLYISAEAALLYKIPLEALYQDFGMLQKAIYPEDVPYFETRYKELFTTGHIEMIYRIIQPGGELRTISEKIRLSKQAEGTAGKMEGLIKDLTDGIPFIKTIRPNPKVSPILTKEYIPDSLSDEDTKRWNYAVEASGSGIWDWDLTTNDIYLSDGWKKMLGYQEDELAQKVEEWDWLIHPNDKGKVYQDIQRHINGETQYYRKEHRLLCKDGMYKWILVGGKVIEFTAQRHAKRFVGIYIDISKNKRQEEILLGQSRILKDIITGKALEEIFIHIIKLIEDLSPQMKASILLVTSSGKHLIKGVAPSIPDAYLKSIDGAEIGPIAGSCGTAVYTATTVIVDDIDTDYRWVNWRHLAQPFNLKACWSMPIILKSKKVVGAFAMYYDHIRKPTKDELDLLNFVVDLAGIAIERYQSEEALKKSEELFKNSFRYASTGMILVDSEYLMFMYANQAFADLIGYTLEELLTHSLSDIIHPEDTADAQLLLHNLLQDGITSIQKEERLVHKNGNTIWVHINVGIIRDVDPSKTYLIAHLQNITDKKQAEEKIITQNNELTKINKELDNFVYRASHDLRAPLTSILGLIDLANEYCESQSELATFLALMQKSVTRLDHFVKGLVDHSRNVRMELEWNTIHFNSMIQEVVETLSYLKEVRQIHWEITVEPEAEFISDLSRLTVIFNNLIGNAIRYTRLDAQPYPYIKIQVHTTIEQARITIQDNGIGIQEEYQNRIFDMFFRASELKSGSGLGLYIVKENLEKLQGTVDVQSRFGQGTTFTLTIPNLSKPAKSEAQHQTIDQKIYTRRRPN